MGWAVLLAMVEIESLRSMKIFEDGTDFLID